MPQLLPVISGTGATPEDAASPPSPNIATVGEGNARGRRILRRNALSSRSASSAVHHWGPGNNEMDGSLASPVYAQGRFFIKLIEGPRRQPRSECGLWWIGILTPGGLADRSGARGHEHFTWNGDRTVLEAVP